MTKISGEIPNFNNFSCFFNCSDMLLPFNSDNYISFKAIKNYLYGHQHCALFPAKINPPSVRKTHTIHTTSQLLKLYQAYLTHCRKTSRVEDGRAQSIFKSFTTLQPITFEMYKSKSHNLIACFKYPFS